MAAERQFAHVRAAQEHAPEDENPSLYVVQTGRRLAGERRPGTLVGYDSAFVRASSMSEYAWWNTWRSCGRSS